MASGKGRQSPSWVDAVEKVVDDAPVRNDRISTLDFLNRYCAFIVAFESKLLAYPPQNRFSTASVMERRTRCEHFLSVASQQTDPPAAGLTVF
jgi:hypothetical protein